MRITTTDKLFKLKSINVTNHDEIWQELYDYSVGETNELNIIGIFFLKLGIVILNKIYPSKPEELMDQESLLFDIIDKLYSYYTDKPNMKKRIFCYFRSVSDLRDTPKNTTNRKKFYAHFMNKGINLSIDIINKKTNITNKETSMGEYVEEVTDGLFDDLRNSNGNSDHSDSNEIDKSQLIDRMSPQEECVINDEEIDEIIKRSSDRKLSGKRIQSTIEEIMERRKWRDKSLYGYYAIISNTETNHLGRELIEKPHLFISGILFPTSDDRLLFLSDCMDHKKMNIVFREWIKSKSS